jgi:hypothetical protein
MIVTFVQVPEFAARWKKLRFTDEDLRSLERLIMTNPSAGKLMQGTGGLRKLRFAPPSRNTGKSGGARAAYAYFLRHQIVYLITLYTKEEKDNLTAAEKIYYRKILQALGDFLDREVQKG